MNEGRESTGRGRIACLHRRCLQLFRGRTCPPAEKRSRSRGARILGNPAGKLQTRRNTPPYFPDTAPSPAEAMKPAQTGVSVVLLGTFKVSDFELDRIHSVKALSESDLEQAHYDGLLREQLVSVTFPWGRMQALSDRLVVEVANAPFVRGPDLLLKMLREASPASIVTKFGINFTPHYRFDSVEARDAFAVRLAPPNAWGWFGDEVERTFKESDDKHGGLMRITMRQAAPSDRTKGWIDVTVEPSRLFGNQGVAITVNDHYEVSHEEAESLRSPRAISEVLLTKVEGGFDLSVERSFRICDAVVGAA